MTNQIQRRANFVTVSNKTTTNHLQRNNFKRCQNKTEIKIRTLLRSNDRPIKAASKSRNSQERRNNDDTIAEDDDKNFAGTHKYK